MCMFPPTHMNKWGTVNTFLQLHGGDVTFEHNTGKPRTMAPFTQVKMSTPRGMARCASLHVLLTPQKKQAKVMSAGEWTVME